MALMLAVGTLAVPAAGVVARENAESDDEVTPGERLSGVVGVQKAEVEGEIETRAYEAELESAESASPFQSARIQVVPRQKRTGSPVLI